MFNILGPSQWKEACKKLGLIKAILILTVIPSFAQQVLPDKITFGAEYVPRYATFLTNSKIIQSGEVHNLIGLQDYNAIEVTEGGTLRCAGNFTLTVTHLIVHPNADFECGTATLPFAGNGLIVIKNVPIDKVVDPSQFGNGIINFGNQTRIGKAKTHKAELNVDAQVGDTVIHLNVPDDWNVGDELFLPDMRQMSQQYGKIANPRIEFRVTISSKTPTTITLSKPLDFEHHSILDRNGNVVAKPRVVNLTRNLVIISEGAVRGHTINLGPTATWDIRYNELNDLGRTLGVPLGPDNLAGRYASHDHQNGSKPGSKYIGNVITSKVVSNVKWGLPQHGTHDVELINNIVMGFSGANFVTEDGAEQRNKYIGNVAIGSIGNLRSATTNILQNNPGAEGTGFWFRGPNQFIENNEAWNNSIGFSFIYQNQVSLPNFNSKTAVPLSFINDIAIGNSHNGYEAWNAPKFTVENFLSAHNGVFQLMPKLAEGHFKNVKAIVSDAKADGFGTSGAYTTSIEIEDSEITGCYTGILSTFFTFKLTNVTFQCLRNILLNGDFPLDPTLTNVTHLPYKTSPRQYIVLRDTIYTSGKKPFGPWNTNGIRINNWQGTGQNYWVFEKQQYINEATWMPDREFNGCPELGLTNLQCLNKYSVAYGGSVTDSTLTLEGINGLVATQKITNPIPRAVLMYPSKYEPVPASYRVLRVFLTLGTAQQNFMLQIDNGVPTLVNRFSQFGSAAIIGPTTPGLHTVKTWRLDLAGNQIPESILTFEFTVQ